MLYYFPIFPTGIYSMVHTNIGHHRFILWLRKEHHLILSTLRWKWYKNKKQTAAGLTWALSCIIQKLIISFHLLIDKVFTSSQKLALTKKSTALVQKNRTSLWEVFEGIRSHLTVLVIEQTVLFFELYKFCIHYRFATRDLYFRKYFKWIVQMRVNTYGLCPVNNTFEDQYILPYGYVL